MNSFGEILASASVLIIFGLLYLWSEKSRLMGKLVAKERIKKNHCLLCGSKLPIPPFMELSPHPIIRVDKELDGNHSSKLKDLNIKEFNLCSGCSEIILNSIVEINKEYLQKMMEDNAGWFIYIKERWKSIKR